MWDNLEVVKVIFFFTYPPQYMYVPEKNVTCDFSIMTKKCSDSIENVQQQNKRNEVNLFENPWIETSKYRHKLWRTNVLSRVLWKPLLCTWKLTIWIVACLNKENKSNHKIVSFTIILIIRKLYLTSRLQILCQSICIRFVTSSALWGFLSF